MNFHRFLPTDWAFSLVNGQWYELKRDEGLSVVAHTCDTSTQETEARGLLVQTSLGYIEGVGKDKRKGEKVGGGEKKKRKEEAKEKD